jgi:hypothetical protein
MDKSVSIAMARMRATGVIMDGAMETFHSDMKLHLFLVLFLMVQCYQLAKIVNEI